MPTTTSARRPASRPAQAVTTARLSPEADRARRMRRYLTAMAVRTISFPVAVWGFSAEHYVLATVAALLATLIPSVAVMVANAVDHRQARPAAPASPVQGLAAGGSGAVDRGDAEGAGDGSARTGSGPVVIAGSLVRVSEGGAELVCSARGCRARPTQAVVWRNPRLHTSERRKTWLACAEHVDHLRDFVDLRGFLIEVVPVDGLGPA